MIVFIYKYFDRIPLMHLRGGFIQCCVRHSCKHIQILLVPQKLCGSRCLCGACANLELYFFCLLPRCFLLSVYLDNVLANLGDGHIRLGDCRSIVFTACSLIHCHVIKSIQFSIVRYNNIHAKVHRCCTFSGYCKLCDITAAVLLLMTFCPCHFRNFCIIGLIPVNI